MGNLDGPGPQAYFSFPVGGTLGPDNALYVGDLHNGVIRKVQPDGSVSTFAGAYEERQVLRDGPLPSARFDQPSGVAFARDGSVYVVNFGGLRRIGTDGMVTTYAYPNYGGPIVAAPQGGIYLGSQSAIFHFDVRTGFTLYAGHQRDTGSNDGDRLSARFGSISGLAIDGAGNVYASDHSSGTVRKITVDGTVSTIGTPGQRGQLDGPASIARFNGPTALTVDGTGTVWVLDTPHTIRRIGPAGEVETPFPSYGTAFRNRMLTGLASDASGRLLALHERGIMRLLPDGTATNFAGQAPATNTYDWSGFIRQLGIDPSGNTLMLGRNETSGATELSRISPTGAIVPYGERNSVPLPSGTTNQALIPSSMAVGSDGHVVVAMIIGDPPPFVIGFPTYAPVGGQLLRISPDGQTMLLAEWPASATARAPGSMALDGDWIYFADAKSGDIVRWHRTNGATEVVLAAERYGGTAFEPSYHFPSTLAIRQGELFMLHAGAIVKIAGGAVQTVVPAGAFRLPTALVADLTSLYVADQEVVWRITGGGAPQALAGTRDKFGVRLSAAPGSLGRVSGLAVEPAGRLHLISGDALITVTPR